MQDDWFSALTLLACERDISESLRVEDVVDKFAGLTAALRRHLLWYDEQMLLWIQMDSTSHINGAMEIDERTYILQWKMILIRLFYMVLYGIAGLVKPFIWL